MNFIGAAKRLDELDIPQIGKMIGVGEDEIRAVLEVESRGKGFDRQNRPIMLFEPHIFHRQLTAHKPGELQRAVDEGLAYRKWGERKYPLDSYPTLQKAIQIDLELALRSASWGLAQIMGFNHTAAGYRTARDMVEDFKKDEEIHVRAMVKFIISAGLDDEIRRRDWSGFARGYNGPGFAKNKYDTKLATAFAKWSKVKDLPT